MHLLERSKEDLKWMVDEIGETVLYRPVVGDEFEVKAFIDRAAVNPPEYGYEQTLTRPHESLVFVVEQMEVMPKRGDTVFFDEREHVVHYVGPVTDTVQVAVQD